LTTFAGEAGVFWSILHRTILWELFKVFFLALVALTGLVLLAGIVAEASQRGLGPAQLLAAIPLIIPSTLPYTIPATTLFATCLVYGRLSADNEILAMKAAGINLLRVIWPAVLLGMLTSVATFALYYHVIPVSQYTMRAQFLKDIEELLYTMLKQDRCVNHPRLNYAIWVRQVEGRRLLDAIFKRRDIKGNYDLVAVAREAELRVDPRKKMLLVHMRHGECVTLKDGLHGYFEDRLWEVELQSDPADADKLPKAREMTWTQLFQRRQEILQELKDVVAEHATASSMLLLNRPPDSLPQHIENLTHKRFWKKRELLIVEVEAHMRTVISAGCLCFVLVGCPVGIWFSKSDYLSAFVTCFLPIVFVYYPLMLCGINVARGGRIFIPLAMWPCNLLMAVISLLLLRRLLRH
jgi:lipopolysaccharide export system permease protein